MRVAHFTAALSALALHACTAYAPGTLSPETSFQRFESTRLDDPRLLALIAGHGAATPVQWNLDTLTRAAIYLSPDLKAARATWHASEAAILAAKRRANPSLTASVGRATNPPEGSPAGLADIALGIRIETAGKRAHRIAQADALSEADRLDLHAAAWQLRGRVRDALLDWKAAGEESSLLDRQVTVGRSIVQMLERRLELGEAAMGEKVHADAAVARALLDRAAASARMADAQSRLAQAIGVAPAALQTVRIAFDGLDVVEPQTETARLRREGLARDDMRASLARYAAADAAYRLEVARQYPDLELGPSYGYDMGTNKISIGVMSVALPVLDRNQGAIAQARARREESAARFEALQATVLAQIDRAGAGEREARAQHALAQSVLRSEREQLAAASRRFDAGAEDRLALAMAQTAAYDAEKTALGARLALQKSIGRIEDAARIALFTAHPERERASIETGEPL